MADQTEITLSPSRLFGHWLRGTGSSLVFTTYGANLVFVLGTGAEGRISVTRRIFERPMGLGAGAGTRPGTLWMATERHLVLFRDILAEGTRHDGHDAVFLPLQLHLTGDVDVHDVACGAQGRPYFAVTRFNCIATLDGQTSFAPDWMPPFIDRLAAEDRCHLNGLALEEGAPAYASAVSDTNLSESWRQRMRDGGVVLDVARNRVLARGLSMPHSPRLYRGALWVLEAGTGQFGRIDRDTGAFTPLCFLPGFARGLAFLGDHAVIGLSRPRREEGFGDLPLTDRLAREGLAPAAGLAVVNLATGDIEHRIEIAGLDELYDVAALPGLRHPSVLGQVGDETRFTIRPGPVPGAVVKADGGADGAAGGTRPEDDSKTGGTAPS